MEFVLVNKFFRVGKTEVSIQCDKPFTFFTRELDGDHLGDTDEMLIEAVKEILRTELDPTSAIVKNQEQLAKTTAALEQANQLMEGMQKVSLHNTDDIEEIFARLEVLEKHNGIDHEHEDEAEGHKETPHVVETEPHSVEPAPVTPPVQPEPQPATEVATNGVPNVVVSEPAPAQPTTEQPVAEVPIQPAPAAEQPTEREKEHEIPTPTSEASTSENNGGSNNE
ncbi:hypothetical protein [Streptococcus mitis]|uniref:hypothetical protein n=1 Tax=Streptococcus mitis TaxID=28037 RepID=UPI00204A16FC|nr:hypothetical protein [Streptococcus mitis]DAX98643.1 MAG TPA: Protein of unknown function (DUF1366) [Caudoviricetes sp.]